MKITQLLQEDKVTLSLEVFPPKKDTAVEQVSRSVREIAALQPDFMSVTYGAGGGTSAYTVQIAKDIKAEYNVPSMAHLTCVSSTKENVKNSWSVCRRPGLKMYWHFEETFRQTLNSHCLINFIMQLN